MQYLVTATSRKDACIRFAYAYAQCLTASVEALNAVLSTLSRELISAQLFSDDADYGMDEGVGGGGSFGEELTAKLVQLLPGVEKAHREWAHLYQCAFDADAQTLLQLQHWLELVALLENALNFVCARPLK